MPARFWRDAAWTDFRVLDAERAVAILPVAAVEQHGPHLPVGVDAFINEGVMAAAIPLLPETAWVLPTSQIGKSDEHLAYPGTLSFSAETLIRLWTETGECVARAGFRKFVMVNSHGGQPQIMNIVARDLRVRLGMFAVSANLSGLNSERGLFSPLESRHGIHAGSNETSQMLHLRPDLVRPDRAENFAPATIAMEQRYRHLRAEGAAVGFGWQTQDLHPSGACGDATDADAERGRRVVQSKAEGVAALIAEIIAFPLAWLKDGPLGGGAAGR
ncbi:MAG: creatininase family protein [Acidisphaera sp.]|nr:creatininase family protein [Acidisphaera sp.]MBV9813179.1 creatininase family protein [Acetobacteraceae bacterium]